MSLRENQSKPLLDLLIMGCVFLGVFVLGCLLMELGIGAYLWLEEPQRLAVRHLQETQTAVIIDPQPLQISPADTNVSVIEPPATAFFSGAANKAAIWVDGKAFKSGGQAGWESVKGAWRLWLLGAGMLIYGLISRRCCAAPKTKVVNRA